MTPNRARHSLTSLIARFRRNEAGGVAITLALAVPAIAVGVAVGADYTMLNKEKSRLQAAVDAAALASARELRLSTTNLAIVDAAVQGVFKANVAQSKWSGSASAATTLLNNGGSVRVSGQETVPTVMGTVLATQPTVIHATATARMLGGAPICVIALDPSASNALGLEKDARLTGVGCAVYSDSTHANGIQAKNSAQVIAALICSAGGVVGNASGLSPAPTTDCPSIPDPFASRSMPVVGPCLQTNLVISGGTQSLNPGVYCGGIRITGGATVTLNSGEFIMKDGAIRVDGNSSLTGANVGFYLTGAGAALNFDSGANTINLTAPVSGSLAGLLVAEDRTNAPGQNHQILSDNARNLLGTVYLPRGGLYVASNAPVADQSAYTIIVANTIKLSAGPNLVLNSNYGSTNIPTPAGTGAGSAILQN
jgi:Flp pilus assembly protein TadG